MSSKDKSTKKKTGMLRREFIRFCALLIAVVSVPKRWVMAAEKPMSLKGEAKVSLAGLPQNALEENVIKIIQEAAEAATDFSWLKKGDAVLLKPASNSGEPYPSTTSPLAIQAMVELLKRKGAGRVILSDMAGIQHVKLREDELKGSTRELMKQSGMLKRALDSGAEVVLPEESGWDAFVEEIPEAGKSWKKGIMMPKLLNEVEHVVLLPRCSRHLLAGATLGMKAAVGYWRTDTRLEYHRDAGTLQEKTAEAATVPSLKQKMRLTLTMADKVLATFGPDKGFVHSPKTGLVFASESLTAHDMVSLAWLLISRSQVPEEEKKGRKDPYTVRTMSNMINKIVSYMLGGVGDAVKSERLEGNKFNSIFDDRVLTRAFEIEGGIPRLKFVDAGAAVPPDVKADLVKMTYPGQSVSI